MKNTYSEITIPDFPLFKKGKVREVYEVGESLLIVASDRISAFDWVLPSLIPNKGKILTQLSKFWFEYTELISPNHMITTQVDEYPEELHKHREKLDGEENKGGSSRVCGERISCRVGMERV
jgi:phosphoribosylaminoimidazole-succinocarboxamide synthase